MKRTNPSLGVLRSIRLKNFQCHKDLKIDLDPHVTSLQKKRDAKRKETWKPIPDYESLYEVSNLGRVRSKGRWVGARNGKRRWMKPVTKRPYKTKDTGTVIIGLWKKNKGKTHKVSHLVLRAFIGPCPAGKECCHYPDPNLSNNQLSNLRWDTSKANKYDQILIGNRKTKLSEKEVLTIRNELKTKYYRGLYRDIAKKYKIHITTLQAIRERRIWNHI